jgi:hypothetical protein
MFSKWFIVVYNFMNHFAESGKCSQMLRHMCSLILMRIGLETLFYRQKIYVFKVVYSGLYYYELFC